MTTNQHPDRLLLSIIVPTYGRGEKLRSLLARLSEQTMDPDRFEVIVVDDGSPEPVQVDESQLRYGFKLVRQENAGPGAARNRALEEVRSALTLILNDDAVPAPDLLEKHVAAHADAHGRGLSKVSVLGTFRFTEEAMRSPFVQLLDGTDLLFDHHRLQHDCTHAWAYFWTCNLSVPTAALREAGGFDSQLFDQAIVEDVELGYRLEQKGYAVLYREDCIAHHDHVLTAESYFKRASLLGFYSTRMWAKHDIPWMMAAKDDETVQARFEQTVSMAEVMRGKPDELVAAFERIPEGTLDRSQYETLHNAIRSATSAPWARGVHLARHGIDVYRMQDEGAPAGTSVSCVVVSCNARANTQRCIEALRDAADERYPQQIVVVDNGSTDGSVEWLRQQSDVKLIENPTNYGAPRARNQAIAQTTGDWIAFFDNDVFVPKGWLDRALYHGEVDPGVGSVALCANRASRKQVVEYHGSDDAASIQAFADAHYASAPRRGEDTSLFTSLAVLVRRAVIDEIGGFDEAFSPWGFEDDDLSLRIHMAGWRNRAARDTFVFHAPYATQEKVERHQAWMEDNWRAFVRKWSPTTQVPALFDYEPLQLPDRTSVTRAQLVAPLPEPNAAPPTWAGEESAQTTAKAVAPAPPSPAPAPAAEQKRDWWSAPESAQRGERTSADGRANVVVMGCGRSGTSMVTGMLAEAGWDVGDDPYPGRPANPKGFFETLEINGLNEMLLSTAVRDEAPLDRMQRWLTATREKLQFDVDPGIEARMQRLGERAPYAYKDPRFCFTLPAWRSALDGAKFVCIFRDPATTAESIVRECREADYLQDLGVTRERALEVWTESYRRVLTEHRQEGDWLFLHFDQLFTPEGVARLEAFVGAKVAADFPERQLSRSRPSREAAPEARALYAELCTLAGMPVEASPTPSVPPTTAPELSVVVCTYNRLDTLKHCLAKFEDQTTAGRYEIVVVNDGATDGTREWLDAWRPTCAHQVIHRANGGLAAARNTGLEAARGKYVLLVNDDTIAFPDMVERHLAAHARHGDGVAVLGTFEQPRAALDNALMRTLEATDLVFCYSKLGHDRRYDWTRFWTCNVSVALDAVRRVGAFDESFQHYGCEDTDLAYRLETELGIEVVYDSTARAHHEHVLSYEDFRRRARTVAGAWVTFFQKHPRALLHNDWRERARNTIQDHERQIVKSLPERGLAEAHAAELARMDLGALERTGPEGAALAEAVVTQLGAYLEALNVLWWNEGEVDAFRRYDAQGMTQLVSRARAAAEAQNAPPVSC